MGSLASRIHAVILRVKVHQPESASVFHPGIRCTHLRTPFQGLGLGGSEPRGFTLGWHSLPRWGIKTY